MKVLVACEESQTVCSAFRKVGAEAYSADIQECSGGHPEWHIQGDVIPLLNGSCSFVTESGQQITVDGKWDLIIAHPPCTDLAVSGARWFAEKIADGRQQRSIEFFMRFTDINCDHVMIENPVGIMSRLWRKPDQIIQPYMFGDPFEKKTCLWLKGLPHLAPTKVVEPPPRQQVKGGKSLPTWYSNAKHADRARIRSKTFPGFAEAMAEQWTKALEV